MFPRISLPKSRDSVARSPSPTVQAYGLVDLVLSRSYLSVEENARVPAGAHPIADLNYHGTHVAATVASNARVAAGVTSRVTLVGMKVYTPGTPADNFNGFCRTSATIAAILDAADMGLDVVNLSIAGVFQRFESSARGINGPSYLASMSRVFNYVRRKGTAPLRGSARNDRRVA